MSSNKKNIILELSPWEAWRILESLLHCNTCETHESAQVLFPTDHPEHKKVRQGLANQLLTKLSDVDRSDFATMWKKQITPDDPRFEMWCKAIGEDPDTVRSTWWDGYASEEEEE